MTSNDRELANKVADFFSEKVQLICNSLQGIVVSSSPDVNVNIKRPELREFSPTSVNELSLYFAYQFQRSHCGTNTQEGIARP